MKDNSHMIDVAIVGGGLSGLINAILLSRSGLKVTLFEKQAYPFHRVCGEYISNEVVPYLRHHGLFPSELLPSSISHLTISDTSGKSFDSPLDMGGFGVSRYAYDHWLASKAVESGACIMQAEQVKNVEKRHDRYILTTANGKWPARLVILAHGKRSSLDRKLKRPFFQQKSPFVGVKYHVQASQSRDRIWLHNFDGGYCGMSAVEGGKFNYCYLVHRDKVRIHGNIQKMEETLFRANPKLREAWEEATFLFDRPQVINEISFEAKGIVDGEFLYCGDSAGMITPLCGNGMAMGIHSAAMLSQIITEHYKQGNLDFYAISRQYVYAWKKSFDRRLWTGRQIQQLLFGKEWASRAAVGIGRHLPSATRRIISLTHGEELLP